MSDSNKDESHKARQFYDLLSRYGLKAEFDAELRRYQTENNCGWRQAFKAVKATFKLPDKRREADRSTGKRSYLDDAEWAYQNLDRAEDIEIEDAPSAGAWKLLQRAFKDPSILDQPLMLLAKRRAADEEERLILKDCERSEGQLQALIDRLLSEPL